MKTLTEHLCQYAIYHMDRRNIATHFIGVPLIMLAVIFLLYIPIGNIHSFVLTPAFIIVVLLSLYYIKLDIKLGLIMSCILSALYLSTSLYFYPIFDSQSWFYILGVGLFLVGWVFQFIGHYYEGKKPAFIDDLMGLVIGPLFVLVEVLFKCRLFRELEIIIVKHAGQYKG